mmetsp:Transcript_43034/g.82500  ORF Transcript_43034/g.82500 Transcript_43034/m.82500 type:complete len:246 (+) Transcript_43034:48-785(+)
MLRPHSVEERARALLVFVEAILAVPLLICQKSALVDRADENKTIYFSIWLTTCICASLRTFCFFGSSVNCQQIACKAEYLTARLSFLLVLCHLTGSLFCGNSIQILLSVWCFALSLVNFTIQKHFGWQVVSLQHTHTNTETKPALMHTMLEVFQCTHKLEQSGTSCVICLDDIKEGDKLGRLSCGHTFHATCVGRWLRVHAQCPYRCSVKSVQKSMEPKKAVADETNQGCEVGIVLSLRTQASPV